MSRVVGCRSKSKSERTATRCGLDFINLERSTALSVPPPPTSLLVSSLLLTTSIMASTNSLNTAHTSSLAATLPPELLRPIFDLAVHNNDSFSKVDLALVCRSWFLASSLHSAFTVSTASSCARLATWLEQTNKGDIVRSLVVHYNAEDPGVVSALAALLRTCHRVTELAIILYGYSQEDQRGQRQFLTRSDEDEELVQALEGLKDLKTVQIGGQHMFDSECASYDRYVVPL